jgi:cytidylate kinase
LIIGIFGLTCSGKTSVADALSLDLSYQVRHCGEIIKQLATRDGRSPNDLSSKEHAGADEETRISATKSRNLIIDGTFLDVVLADVRNCKLVKLTCDAAVREARYNVRRSGTSFADRESLDADLRQRLYQSIPNRAPDMELDTTSKTADVVAHEIAKWLMTVKLDT